MNHDPDARFTRPQATAERCRLFHGIACALECGVPKRSCNRHADCAAADARARALALTDHRQNPWAEHCDDAGCEDCFGS